MISLVLLLLAIFVGPIVLGLLFYFIPKNLGFPKTAKYLTLGYGILLLILIFLLAYEDKISDQLFTKNNAQELVEEQGIKLNDEFDLISINSISGVGEYYQTFTLNISESDKQNAILKIKNSDNFEKDISSIDLMLHLKNVDNIDYKITQNYETHDSYVREYLLPNEKKDYTPIFRRVSISKKIMN